MKIERISLKKFEPFVVPSIDYIDINFKEDMQIILGTNGCGKSKLLGQLTPMPAEPRWYGPNGHKIIFIKHDGVSYTLTSKFDEKGKGSHSFFINDTEQELNQGGTITVQRQLVEQYFKYNDKIHEILTGKVKFTTMSNQARKEFLFRVSNMDFDYALSLFDMARTKHRDIVGACKHITARINDLSARVATDEERTSLEARLDALMTDADAIKAAIAEFKPDISQTNRYNGSLESEIDAMLKQNKVAASLYEKEGLSLGAKSFLSVGELNSDIGGLKERLAGLNEQLEEVNKKAMEVTSIGNKMEMLNDDEKDGNIEQRIQYIEEKISEVEDLANELADTNGMSSAVVNDVLMDYMNLKDTLELPIQRMDRDEAFAAKQAYLANLEKITKVRHENQRLSERLNELVESSCIKVKCVRCDHVNTVDPEATEENMQSMKQHISNNLVLLDHLEKTKDKMEQGDYGRVLLIERAFNTISMFHSKMGIKMTSSLLMLDSNTESSLVNLMMYNSDRATIMFQKLASTIDAKTEYRKLSNKLDLLRDYMLFKDMDVAERIEYLEKEYIVLEDTIVKIEHVIEKKTNMLTSLTEMEEHNTRVVELVHELENRILSDFSMTLSEEMNKRLHHVKEECIKVSSALYDAKHSIAVLNSTKEELVGLDKDRKEFKILVDVLSPTTGIIGDALRTLLESFTADVNKKIASIWSYDMEVLPYANENKLDFKLPISIIDKVFPDISEGSDGQKDVIDLAISLCVMDYMDLEDYPAFMDEVGSTFDPGHSAELINFTNRLVEEKKVSQLFMISHHVTQYGGHLNADAIVLAEGNFALPEVYNQNVLIK